MKTAQNMVSDWVIVSLCLCSWTKWEHGVYIEVYQQWNEGIQGHLEGFFPQIVTGDIIQMQHLCGKGG